MCSYKNVTASHADLEYRRDKMNWNRRLTETFVIFNAKGKIKLEIQFNNWSYAFYHNSN